MTTALRLSFALLLVLCAVSRAPAACSPADCNDANLCTVDSCDPVDGCINTPTPACSPRLDYTVTGKKVKIHIPPTAPDQEGLRLLHTGGGFTIANLPVPESPGDPVAVGGSLRLFSTAGGFDVTYPLPESHWDYYPFFSVSGYKGFQYRDPQNVEGPVGMIKIIVGSTMKLKAKGPAFQIPLASNPDPVHVILSVGDHRYCMTFGGEAQNYIENRIFWAKRATASASCPCKINADCDDGDAGNGQEVCSAGFCP